MRPRVAFNPVRSLFDEKSVTDPLRPAVLIYRNELLERSETFIAAQTAALTRYRPVYCGLRFRPDGLLPADARAILLGKHSGISARIRRTLYLHTGHAPAWLARVRIQQCSLVHVHFALDAACALPLVEKLGLPMVVTLHGYDVTSSRATLQQSRGGRLYLRRQAALFRYTRSFICVSEFIRTQAILAGFPPEKLLVHSIGIDLNAFRLHPEETIARSSLGPLILFTGRLVEKKGCIHLLRAMQIVQHTQTARLVIIGDGPLRQQLERSARELQLRHCAFLGAQPPSAIQSWLRQAAVFCVPSITASNGDSEGLGMVFCEAQAMGVPVVSSSSGGIPEAVLHSESGFLVPEGDHAALAANILRLLDNQGLHQQMSAAGRRHVAQKFDIRTQTALLEAHYDTILERQQLPS